MLLTGSLWLLAIPFYPKRCIICGSKERGKEPKKEALPPKKWHQTWWGLLLILFTIGYVASLFEPPTKLPEKKSRPKTLTDKSKTLLSKDLSSSLPDFEEFLSWKSINTPKEFEGSKYYQFMKFNKISINATKVGYYSPSTNMIVGLKLRNGKIIESRMAYSKNRLPSDIKTLFLDIFMFIAHMTGANTSDEVKDLAWKISDRLSDKSKVPFVIKGKKVTIDLIDTPERPYLGVIIR